MNKFILLFILFSWSCTKPDPDAEKTAIIQLLDDETKFAANADSTNWSRCWTNNDEVKIIIATADAVQQYVGFAAIKKALFADPRPFDIKLKRENYYFVIDNDVAFVTFDQADNWGGEDGRKTIESRTLRKVNNAWKIVNSSVIALSSDETNTTSFHMAKEKIAVNPDNGMHNLSGLGGMAVGFVEVPAGMDFGPLFAGLPQNMCPSPHWGYLFEGAVRIKYADGKEEDVHAGEVFYMPAPHTGVVLKDAKFIDFSPETEFAEVMANIAKVMKAQSGT